MLFVEKIFYMKVQEQNIL